MKQIVHETQEHLEALKSRALVMKPNIPNVIATSMGWGQPRQNGTIELLVSFGGLDSLLGLESQLVDDEPLAVNIMSDLAIESPVLDDSDDDLPPPNKLAASILTAPIENVGVKDEAALKAFLEQSKVDEDDEEEVVEAPKKKGGRPKKVA